MKQISFLKLFSVVLFISSIAVSTNIAIASDSVDPCVDRPQIELNSDFSGGIPADLQNYLTNYLTRAETAGGAYYLNFNPADIITISRGLSVTILDSSDLYICNLAIVRHPTFTADTPLLTLSGTGLGRVHLYNVKIAGNASRSGPCLSVAANGATVAASEFSSCSEGVSIAASNTLLGAPDAAHYTEEKNVIHDNGIGIHQVSGSGNKWG